MFKNRLLNWVLIISLLVQSAIFGMLFGKIKAEAHDLGICNGMHLKTCEGASVSGDPSAVSDCECGGYVSPIVQTADAIDVYNGARFMSICDNSWP